MGSFTDIVLNYICPTLGSIMASVYFAAPVRDLRQALIKGSLGSLNPFPWSFCTGNTLGWVVYGYYTRDPFVVAANLPGLVLSIWLNSGASKLQYLALAEARNQRLLRHQERQQWDASRPIEEVDDEVLMNDSERSEMEEAFVMVPQEKALLRILTVWAAVIVYVGWFSRSNPASIIGVIVNINLIVFYGAPLQTMQTVIATKNSESIHVPTMVMNWLNTSFWIGYGIARHDAVIIVPNVLGLCLGLMQGVLKALYPSRPSGDLQPVPGEDDDDESNSMRSPLPQEDVRPETSIHSTSINRHSFERIE